MKMAGRRPILDLTLALALAGVLAAPVLAVSEFALTTGDTLTIPGQGQLTGLTMAGEDTLALLTVIPDSLSTSGDREVWLVLQDSLGGIHNEADFSGVLDRALAWDGESFWACGDADDGSSIIYKIVTDTLGVLVIEDAITGPWHRPTSLAFDGRYLWLTDRDSGRIDRFDPEVQEFTRSVVAPAFSPYGLAWDGFSMWLTDSGTGRLYRLTGSRLRWSGTVAPDQFLVRGQDVRLFFDGEILRYLPPGERIAIGVTIE